MLQTLILLVAMIQLPGKWFNDYYKFLLAEPWRSCPTQILYGGSSSGKSTFDAQRRVFDAINEPRNYLMTRNVGNTLLDTSFAETVKAIKQFCYTPFFKITESPHLEITYLPRGNKFIFRGLDDPEKLKSITPDVGVLTDLDVEEATEISEDAFDSLELRLRGISPVPKRQFLRFNPVYHNHWIAKRFFNQQLIRYKHDPGRLLILHSTHLNNQFLTSQDHQKIESKTGYYHDVYAEGKWGVLGKLIYTNWRVDTLNEKDFGDFRYGLDFGFAGNPAACHKYAYQRDKKKIFVLGEVYGYGMTNDILAARIKPMVKDERVMADSEDPKSIAELQADKKNHIDAVGVVKGPGSVRHGIQWLQQHEIIVDRSCQYIQNELSMYQWKKDKYGNEIPEPIKANDHCVDDMRYAFEAEMSSVGAPDIYIR